MNVIRHRHIFFLLILGLLGCSPEPKEDSDPTQAEGPEITLPAGFKATLIYRPSDHEEGSWVCITTDRKGRLIASDQYGYLYRITPPSKDQELKVEKIPLEVGQAQGLLWAFNSLYVSVNTYDPLEGRVSGVYRLTDSDNDDQLDRIETLVTLDGAGEHGPHSLVLSPDGTQIYLIAGNHTDIPASFSSVLPPVWREDRLFPAVKDPRGHANDRGAPGGWIARTDSLGKSWEVVATGFRNAYDMAFNEQGELFTYDSDMEWDLGTPWYRPTRICHVIPGSEFGWRTGSAKWPDYYPDNLPGILPMGQGSPTGVVFGKNTRFPTKYQGGLFVLDWSFGTIYFVGLTPSGASYEATREEFLSGTPLPLTDLVVANDGSMYFTTGGRRVASSLYQVTFEGTESIDPPAPSSLDPILAVRKQLEDIKPGQEDAVKTIWPNLQHGDRFIRYAARVALEKQPIDHWISKLSDTDHPDLVIQTTLALSRMGSPANKSMTIKRISMLDPKQLSDRQKIDMIRAYGLLFSRWGPPSNPSMVRLPDYPSGMPAMDRELCDLLAFLQDPSLVKKTIPLMEAVQTTLEADLTQKETLDRSEQYGPLIAAMHQNRPVEQSMAYARSLSQTKVGWTSELRIRYFKWFYRSLSKSGGESYRGFLERIRLQALNEVPQKERTSLAALSGEALLQNPNILAKGVEPPKGPGRLWEVGDANDLISQSQASRSFAHGEQMYKALTCGSCHTMQGIGGTVGPDLTQLSTRFSTWDVLQSLQTPSLAISDQYSATIYTLKDGTTIMGRTLSSGGDSLFINMNPYEATKTRAVALSDVVSQEISPISLMPAGLINQLNEQELLDFMAYLQSGGDPNHEVFQEGE